MIKSRERLAGAAVALATLGVVTAASDVRAAGLYVSDRGVRPLGRGGAFVAGADDLGAIWYNPAGIVDAPSSLLLDGSYIHYTDTFTRQAASPSGTGTWFTQDRPTVNGTTPFLPIPTIAASYRWGQDKQYAAAFGIYAPDAALLSYPATGSQRYTLVSMSGSILAVVGGWFAWKPIEEIRLGAGVQMLTGYLKTTIDLSACPPDNLVCAPESSDYATFTSLKAGPIFAPSANAGATWVPTHAVRLGLSGQAPFVISAPATVNVRLPNAPEFDSATQQGTAAHVHLELPPVLRAGIELRPLDSDDLRMELTYVREFWSVEKSLDITPDNIQIANIVGFPTPLRVNPISIPRGMKDTNSLRLGVEYKYDIFGQTFLLRGGLAYETSSVPPAYESALTIDSNKIVTSIGGSIVVSKQLRLDGVISHAFESDVTVSGLDAKIPIISAVTGNPTTQDMVNGGTYHANLWIIGGGLEYRF